MQRSIVSLYSQWDAYNASYVAWSFELAPTIIFLCIPIDYPSANIRTIFEIQNNFLKNRKNKFQVSDLAHRNTEYFIYKVRTQCRKQFKTNMQI